MKSLTVLKTSRLLHLEEQNKKLTKDFSYIYRPGKSHKSLDQSKVIIT